MTSVKVTVSGTYEVRIGAGLLDQLGEALGALAQSRTALLVSDDTVNALYGERAVRALETNGFTVKKFVFPHGETSKNGETYLRLVQFAAEQRLTRADTIVALGGGVVGDLAGFAAATYLRGVRLVQVPTTLLAAVDSSVGGKTAIDLPAGKNLVGAFYQPSLVLCDYELLRTLPQDVFADGCAEVIKYSILGSPTLYEHLVEKGLQFDMERVIAECVAMKRNVVCDDEFDTGRRQLLNLGHTVAHGIEACSGYKIPHGRAVAAGLAIITRAAAAKGLCDPACVQAVETVLNAFGLPIDSAFTAEELTDRAQSDKKRSGGTITLIIPRAVGQCDLMPIPVAELGGWITAGLRT